MRLFVYYILILGLCFIGACQPQNLKSNIDPNLSKDHQEIRLLTDQALIALTTRNYVNLKKLLGHKDPLLSGRQAAQQLLGIYTATATIERWEAKNTQVTISETQLTATASGVVLTKRSANRKFIQTPFIFHFYRRSINDSWSLLAGSP